MHIYPQYRGYPAYHLPDLLPEKRRLNQVKKSSKAGTEIIHIQHLPVFQMHLELPKPTHEKDHRAILQEFLDIGEIIMPMAMELKP